MMRRNWMLATMVLLVGCAAPTAAPKFDADSWPPCAMQGLAAAVTELTEGVESVLPDECRYDYNQ